MIKFKRKSLLPRIKLELPEKLIFTTEILVRITDINYGGHLGNDSILSIVQEARVQFLQEYNYSEKDVEGFGIIMTDCAIIYKSESFYGDVLQIKIGVKDFFKYGCDIYYQIINKKTGKDVAIVKTGIMFFDYEKRKRARVPEKFIRIF
jgi:acyl-CoA thioesterase FadM